MSADIPSHLKPLKKIRNIGIAAHIDAGKTTLTERILFISGRIYKMGEVHDGTAVMDYLQEEQERGITITSAVTLLEWKGSEIHLIDTPGHVDFTIEVERSLRVLDGMIAVFDAVNGVEPQSETVWYQADRYHVPRIAFMNKMDRVGADFEGSVKMMREKFSQKIVPVQIPIGSESRFQGCFDLIAMKGYLFDGINPGEFSMTEVTGCGIADDVAAARERMIEALADLDDDIAEKYLDGERISEGEIHRVVRENCVKNRLVPVFCGSALRNKGVPQIIDAVVNYLPSPLEIGDVQGFDPVSKNAAARPHDPKAPLCALAFKVQSYEEGRRLTLVRIYSGEITEKDEVYNANRKVKEKLSRIFALHAKEKKRLEKASAGSIVAVMGLRTTTTGDTLADENAPIILERIEFYEPVISQLIEPETMSDRDKLLASLGRVSDEDPTFKYREDGDTGEVIISGMGELHLEVVANRIRNEFGLPVRTGKPQVLLNETLTRLSEGTGLFEAEREGAKFFCRVGIRVEPAARGCGVAFDIAPGVYIAESVRQFVSEGAIEAFNGGVLHGYPVIDVKGVLTAIEYSGHIEDSVGFKIAVSQAVKDACIKGEPKILEPVMKIEIIAPYEFMGEIIGSIQARKGTIEGFEEKGNTRVIKAAAPLDRMFGYSTELRSLTAGRGTFSMKFSHYDVV